MSNLGYYRLLTRRVLPIPPPAPIVYATIDPSSAATNPLWALSSGNLVATSTSGGARANATVSLGAVKRCWEMKVTSNGSGDLVTLGINNSGPGFTGFFPGQDANSYGFASDGSIQNSSGGAAYGTGFSVGDILLFAYDGIANTIQLYVNGVASGSTYTIPSGTYYPCFGRGSNPGTGTVTCNFGPTISGVPASSGNPPSGFTIGVY